MEEMFPNKKVPPEKYTESTQSKALPLKQEGSTHREDAYLISIILSDVKMRKYSNLLKEIGLEKIFETADIIKRDIEVINQFAETVSNPNSLELQDVHHLLENNIWLIDDHYRYYSSNISLRRIVEDEIKNKYRKNERKRPDIVCKNNYDDYIVIELKRPNHEINSSDFAQLLVYASIIKAHCPNCRLVEGYLIGSKYDEALRSDIVKDTRIHLLSYNEILSDVESRYKRHLETFEKEGLL